MVEFVRVILLWSTLAFAGTTLISCTMMLSSWIIRTTGLLEVWVILYIRPVWPGTSDHCTRGWVELLPLVVPFLHRSIGTSIPFTIWHLKNHQNHILSSKKFISLRFEGDWKQHWGFRKILGNCGSKTLSYKNIRYSWLENILYLTKFSTFSIEVKS